MTTERASGQPLTVEGQNNLIPVILRDNRGRVRWKLPGSSPEENLRIGTRSIQAAILENFPEVTSLFPRNEQGAIPSESKKQAEDFILRNTQNDRQLRRLIVHSPPSTRYPREYRHFGNSFVFTLAIVFEEWGLFEVQKQEFLAKNKQLEENKSRAEVNAPETIRLVNPENGEERVITAVNQKTGRNDLLRMFRGELAFSNLKSVYITDVRLIRANATPTIYIGEVTPDNNSTISLNKEAYKDYEEHGALLLIPREEPKFGYKWLDVYTVEPGDKVDLSKRKQSIRINLETKRLENNGWFGNPNLQAFLDYIYGKIQLRDPNELPEFTSKVGVNGIYLASYNDKIYTISMHNPQIVGSDVVIVPKCNLETGYFWLEGFNPEDTQREKPLFTRRVVYEEKGESPSIIDWKGPQVQVLIDWIYTQLPLSSIHPVELLLNQNVNYSDLNLDGNLKLQLTGNGKFDKTKPVLFSPRQSSPYRWIEAHQQNSLISSWLIETVADSIRLSGGWIGIERQALIDFLDEKVNFDQLREMNIRLNNSKTVYLCHYRENNLRLAFRTTEFSPGEELIVKPTLNKSGELVLKAFSDGSQKVLKQFIFDKSANQFKVLDVPREDNQLSPRSRRGRKNTIGKPFGYWSEELVIEEIKKFCEEHGDVSILLLTQENRFDLVGAIRRHTEGIVAMREKLGINNYKQEPVIPAEQANEQLRKLLEE